MSRMRWIRTVVVWMMTAVLLVVSMCACGKEAGGDEVSSSDVVMVEEQEKAAASRTIMLYPVGSNLETNFGSLTKNMMQMFRASIPDDVNVLVTTTGSSRWFMESEYLYDMEGGHTEIDIEKKQIWKLTGSLEEETARMTLVGELELSEGVTVLYPECLTAYINYCISEYPADHYDLIMWDHGYGPMGFGEDFAPDADMNKSAMSVADMAKGIRDSNMSERFEILNFDACLMSNVEVILGLADYADYFAVSVAPEPGDGENYDWLSVLHENPNISGYELGKAIVDTYVDYYDNAPDVDFREGTMAVIDTDRFLDEMLDPLIQLTGQMKEKALLPETGTEGDYQFYDAIISSQNVYTYSTYSLYDLGLFAENLGIDMATGDIWADDGSDQAVNDYTNTVKPLLLALRDSEMIYARSSEAMHKTVSYAKHRDEDGTIVRDDQLIPSGISIFFPDNQAYNVKNYIKAMDELNADLAERDGAVGLSDRMEILKNLETVAAAYEMILSSGRTVAELTENGEVGLATGDVIANWKADDPAIIAAYEAQGYDEASMPERTKWDQSLSVVYEKLDVVLKEASVDIEGWLADIIRQQEKECVRDERIRIETGEAETLITVDGGARRCLHSIHPIYGDITILPEEGENEVSIGSTYGTYAETKNDFEDQVVLASASQGKKWYEFVDSEGKSHVMAAERDAYDENLLLVPVMLFKAADTSDEYSYDDIQNGLFYVKQNGDQYEITGFRISYESNVKQFTEEEYGDYTLYMTGKDASGQYVKLAKDSPIAVRNVSSYQVHDNVPLEEIDDMTEAMITSFSQSYTVRDLYGVDHTQR